MATNGLISITLKHNYHWEYVMGTAFDIKMSNVTFYCVHIDSILLNEIRCYDMDSNKTNTKISNSSNVNNGDENLFFHEIT